MKNKSKLLITTICILIVIGTSGFIIYNKYLNKEKNENVYKIIYDDLMEPSTVYEINIYNDKIEINSSGYSSIPWHGKRTCQYSYTYSKENIDKLKKFIDSNFTKSENNNIEISAYMLDEYQAEVIKNLLNGEKDFGIK